MINLSKLTILCADAERAPGEDGKVPGGYSALENKNIT